MDEIPRSRIFEGFAVTLHALDHHPDGAPAALFLHGWIDHAHSFDPLIALLPSTLRAVALDLRGHGRSTHAPQGAYYATDYLTDVDACLDALGLEQAHVVGHSLGGMVALLYAAARPERVRSLTLIESLGPLPTTPEQAVQRARRFLDELRRPKHEKRYADVGAAAARLRENNPTLSEAAALHLATHGTVASDGGVVFRFDPALRRTAGMGFDDAQTLAACRAVRCPVQLLIGTSGLRLDPAVAQARLTALGSPPVHSLEGGHHVHLDRPAEVAKLVRAFMLGE